MIRTRLRLALLFVVGAASACADAPGAELASNELRLTAVSTQPHLVTGGDVLLRIEAGPAVDLDGLTVRVGSTDVTGVFRPAPDGAGVLGLVSGLADGNHVVEANAPGAGSPATLDITSYPITGPILSGAHQQPFVCQTESFRLAAGGTLGPPMDPACSAATRIDYLYFSSADNRFHPLPSDGSTRPQDIATATTLDGATVPFIVRVETGTVNRAIYEIALLHDPMAPEPDPWTRSPGWNGKLVYTHGGGCRAGWHQQGNSTGGVLREGLLEMGYALTSSSLNVFGQNCSDLLASETHIMVKERFVEGYGVPVYTISTGASGGSYQSHQTADNYPGVFDGLIVSSSFPDVLSATIFTLADARLLYHYFANVAPGTFTEEEQRLVSGFGSYGSIANLSAGAARLDPTYTEGGSAAEQGGEVSIPELEALRYSETNPTGIRATVYDHMINALGRDPVTGFAARPLDNVGVQYGLDALNRGQITKAQFLALNRGIGGFDADLNHVAARHRADPAATDRAVGSGRILFGGAGLASTPVIDYRSYTDHARNGDIHMIVHQFTTRARLQAANGHTENHVMTVGGRWGFTAESPDLGELFRQMDQWLMALRADRTDDDPRVRLARARPAELVDSCWDNEGESRSNVRQTLTAESSGRCGEIYPVYPTPRQVAGGPLTNEVVTCQLKPIDPADYRVGFTEVEISELRAIFPEGVCDWTKPDPNVRGYRGTWLSFGPSPVNRIE
jgi:hypothetical protein